MDWLNSITIEGVDRLGAMTAVTLIAILVIMDKLVWHTRLKKAEERADKWEAKAWEAVQAAQAGVRAAEVAVDVIASMPDPQGKRDRIIQEGADKP
jgi:phage shock protein A